MGLQRQKILTKEGEFQQKLQYETELHHLQHEYNVLSHENAQLSLAGPTKLLRKYRVFSILNQELQNIHTDLQIASSPGAQNRETQTYKELSGLLDKYRYFKDFKSKQQRYLKEVDGQIEIVSKRVAFLQKHQVTDRQCEDRIYNARKILEALENNLDTQMKKFNLISAKNYQLRLEINHLLWNRKNFLHVWHKLIERLCLGKKIMLDLIEQATIAYDRREDWCKKLQRLRLNAFSELHSNSIKMKQLCLQLNHSNKLVEFFNIKGQRRVMLELQHKKQIKRLNYNKKLEKRKFKYSALLEKVQKLFGKTEVAKIAKIYYNTDAEQFSKFQYIIESINEVEYNVDQLGRLHYEIDDQNVLKATRDFQQQVRLGSIAQQLNEILEKTNQQKQELLECNKHLDLLMSGILDLCTLTNCIKNPLLALLGKHSEIKIYNVLLYVKLLEEHINYIILKASYKESSIVSMMEKQKKVSDNKKIFSTKIDTYKIYSIGKIVKADPCALCVEKEIVSDVIDNVQRVWNRKECQERLKQRLKLPEVLGTVHTLSACHLPASRRLMQKKFE